ncbi:thioesterase family protein [Phaeacidiphilus oryzae]|uniref:thioesterase family protein n=1 Tax=Phaeacidiphilus oryzae TaxID=348818 RepID=UPI00055A40C2|nr:thioesterase family protein [Phaeacidiphilus oryzae]
MTALPLRLPLHREAVRQEWIDYNGHLSEAYYVLVFGHATDALMAGCGLDADYRASTGCSLYTVESHLRYLREVPDGAQLAVRTRVLAATAKKAHFTHEMYVLPAPDAMPLPDAAPAATTELLTLHVDQATSRTAPFPERSLARLHTLTEPPPPWTGRAISLAG